MDWKRIAGGVAAIASAFMISFLVLSHFLGVEMWADLPVWLAFLIPPAGAWGISSALGERIMSGKRAAAVATICLIVIVPAFHWKNNNFSLQCCGGTGENEAGDNHLSIENQKPKDVLFEYRASFQYLKSGDNEPLDQLFLIFPCPTVDNDPVLDVDTKGGTDPTPQLENVTWQLWMHYENNGENIHQLEVENGIAAGLVKPRAEKPSIHKPWVENTSHGPKIWYQFGTSFEDFAFYPGEMARIKAVFSVPKQDSDKVTLVNKQGGVYAAASGYTMEKKNNYNFLVFDGKFKVSLSKVVDGQVQTVNEYSETEWELLPEVEWQDYRLDS